MLVIGNVPDCVVATPARLTMEPAGTLPIILKLELLITSQKQPTNNNCAKYVRPDEPSFFHSAAAVWDQATPLDLPSHLYLDRLETLPTGLWCIYWTENSFLLLCTAGGYN